LQTNFLIKNIKALHPCGVAVSKAAGS
jgi:hypothetical protein